MEGKMKVVLTPCWVLNKVFNNWIRALDNGTDNEFAVNKLASLSTFSKYEID